MTKKITRSVGKTDRDLRVEAMKPEFELTEPLVSFMRFYTPSMQSAMKRCLETGLLPSSFARFLDVLQFLAKTVISAQRAQRLYGVRASVLLAMALDESSFNLGNLIDSQYLDTESQVIFMANPYVDKWFLKRAKKLSTDKRLRKAMSSANDPKAYLFELFGLGFCDLCRANDLMANIEEFNLESCDAAGMFPLGQYRALAFEEIRDAGGRLI